jgi:excisionase family DNA binding protein
MDQETRLLLRISEVAEQLSISRSQVWKMVWDGTLPSVKIGRAVRVPTVGLTEYAKGLIGQSIKDQGKE